ncbi:ABC transporter ATP-binding protein [Maricaulis maris]|uniref:ABC transporter ATP-binding protein n=1 Tax=Maricaulis maris TaxID=74318 RepID=UPI003A91123C
MYDGSPVRPVLDIEAVSKRFGRMTVLDTCTLSVAEGEILTLLGASGCGKTTLLRCIAGFWAPEQGRIRIDGADTAKVPVNRRPVGVVFQSYALFPHMTVAQNVAYGLKMNGVAKTEIASRIAEALRIVSLTGFEGRYPGQLSGGQQQRVAVARVLVLQPRVLLLDEPFSALDAKLRGTMQVEMRELIKRLGITAIFVTHDQEEALTLSDRIAVMRGGRIEQLATPDEVFDHPATAYVADFVGESNFIEGIATGGRAMLPDGQALAAGQCGPVRIMIRPHNLCFAESGWGATVTERRNIGAQLEYTLQDDAGRSLRLASMRQGRGGAVVGDRVSIGVVNPGLCPVYGAEA